MGYGAPAAVGAALAAIAGVIAAPVFGVFPGMDIDALIYSLIVVVVGGVFIFVGFKPNTQLVEGHVDHDAGGYLITDNRMMTSMAGLFAAGDVRSQVTRQITTAVGDATTAAIAVEKYLKSLREQQGDGKGTKK